MSRTKESPDFTEVAVATYGAQGAYDIMATLRDSIVFTNEMLRPPEAIDYIGVRITNPFRDKGEYKIRGIHSDYAGMDIELANVPAAEIIPLVPATALHEGSHIVRYQYGVESGEYTDDYEFTLFDIVVDEGIAVLTEAVILDEWSHTCITVPSKILKAGLAEVLAAGVVSDEERYAFMERDDNRGYKIGHYLVTALALRMSDPDLHALIKLPVAEYQAFAEKLI